ncbi:hypothetical protein BB560_004117 [Smittium megazygosporum]|uniref:Calcineurin-like phosphoesterase domain-containing protein n=1 Tax=Smittium megazygosporum TaxID=133381 RepID=A0A2T9ZA67_9FUNG|nr:hypothetical protein BB560_004117 [Smittium megazygosporum]
MQSLRIILVLTLFSLCSLEVLGFGIKCRPEQHNVDQGMNLFSLSKDKNDKSSSDSLTKKKRGWKRPGKVPKNLKIAIFGDIGLKKKSVKVLKMVNEWGPDGIIMTGDYDYVDKPLLFEQIVDDNISDNVPIFGAIGNHDIVDWGTQRGYQNYFINRLKRLDILDQCVGDFGNILLSGVGTRGYAHADFIEDTLALSESSWKICVWHKCQKMYQTGKKKNQTGYGVYDMCRKFGAIVTNSHVHQYSRSKLISHYKRLRYENQTSHIDLNVKQSLNIVSGIGGYSVDKYFEDLKDNPWWASTLAKEDGVKAGAVLCTFHVEDDPNKAYCEFKDIDGKVWDSWTMISHIKHQRRPTRIENNLIKTMFEADQQSDTMDMADQISSAFEPGNSYSSAIKPTNQAVSSGLQNHFVNQFGSERNMLEIMENDDEIIDKEDYFEFSVTKDSDIGYGTLGCGIKTKTELSYVPMIPTIKSNDAEDLPLLMITFNDIAFNSKIMQKKTKFSEAYLQVLGVRKKHRKEALDSVATKSNLDFSRLRDMFFGTSPVIQSIKSLLTLDRNVNLSKLMKVKPIVWEIKDLQSDEVFISENLASQTNKILFSKNWKAGDAITVFVNPVVTKKHLNRDAFFIYANGISNGCFAPSIVFHK